MTETQRVGPWADADIVLLLLLTVLAVATHAECSLTQSKLSETRRHCYEHVEEEEEILTWMMFMYVSVTMGVVY